MVRANNEPGNPDGPQTVRLRLRALKPADKPLLTAGFERLSHNSRRSRYFRPKNQLTEDDLRQLTEFDGSQHFALGAFECLEDGAETAIIGVARYFRLTQSPHTAELSVAVIDDRQGRGVGRLLVRRLLEEALNRGVTHVICHVLADNDRMLKLTDAVFGKTVLDRKGEIVVGKFSVHHSLGERKPNQDPQRGVLF